MKLDSHTFSTIYYTSPNSLRFESYDHFKMTYFPQSCCYELSDSLQYFANLTYLAFESELGTNFVKNQTHTPFQRYIIRLLTLYGLKVTTISKQRIFLHLCSHAYGFHNKQLNPTKINFQTLSSSCHNLITLLPTDFKQF